MSNLTFEAVRIDATRTLTSANIEYAHIDARILLMHASGLDRAGLISNARESVPSDVKTLFDAYIVRRLAHEPVAYITGFKEFWSLDFKVTQDVLIPRPDTEGVVVRSLEVLAGVDVPHILDIGTGSGVLLISLLHKHKAAQGLAVDISQTALDIAQENAKNLGVADRATFLKADFLTHIPPSSQFDLIVSNPPYITDEAMLALDATVKDYEPALALQGGVDGLTPYRTIINEAHTVLKLGGNLVFEVGYDQGEAVNHLLQTAGYVDVKVEKDVAGHDRVVSGRLGALN